MLLAVQKCGGYLIYVAEDLRIPTPDSTYLSHNKELPNEDNPDVARKRAIGGGNGGHY